MLQNGQTHFNHIICCKIFKVCPTIPQHCKANGYLSIPGLTRLNVHKTSVLVNDARTTLKIQLIERNNAQFCKSCSFVGMLLLCYHLLVSSLINQLYNASHLEQIRGKSRGKTSYLMSVSNDCLRVT